MFIYLFVCACMYVRVHMCVCACLYVHVYVVQAEEVALCRPEESVRYPRVGAVGHYEPPYVGTGNQTQVFWKRSKQS